MYPCWFLSPCFIWLEFLDYTTEFSGEIIIVGDLNFHLDDVSDCGGRRFTESLSDRGLVQQVEGPTHIRGHTLDVIISRENSSILFGEPSIEDTQIYNDKSNAFLDHFAVHSRINLSKPARLKKSLTIRKINNIDVESFKADIDTNCFIHNNDPDIENLFKSHNSDLKAVLDKHAPVQTKIITIRPNTEWYGDKIRKAKVKRRKAERTMRKTKLEDKNSRPSTTVPTVVLLNKSKSFLAFGYDAEEQYSALALDEEHHDYYYFCGLKMLQHEIKHTRQTMIKDEHGKEMPALDILSLVIKNLKGHLLETVRSRNALGTKDVIHWVLTVPAIWTEYGIQFMREASKKVT
ncbi:unnamed protein product [Mytilus edulis]|uniref:Endonuclease/exonuclease/phosphatase domain-containing protein n=1 Tax=Mytilus edulis TaxID=6550 RepID=A0A8S3UVC9_MYTED|nr:unnamed protein product [Mytilus edulis]